MPIGVSALVSKSRSSRGRRRFINLFSNPLAGSGDMQQLPNAHVIVLFPIASHLVALIVSIYLAQPRIPADEFPRQAGGHDPLGNWWNIS